MNFTRVTSYLLLSIALCSPLVAAPGDGSDFTADVVVGGPTNGRPDPNAPIESAILRVEVTPDGDNVKVTTGTADGDIALPDEACMRDVKECKLPPDALTTVVPSTPELKKAVKERKPLFSPRQMIVIRTLGNGGFAAYKASNDFAVALADFIAQAGGNGWFQWRNRPFLKRTFNKKFFGGGPEYFPVSPEDPKKVVPKVLDFKTFFRDTWFYSYRMRAAVTLGMLLFYKVIHAYAAGTLSLDANFFQSIGFDGHAFLTALENPMSSLPFTARGLVLSGLVRPKGSPELDQPRSSLSLELQALFVSLTGAAGMSLSGADAATANLYFYPGMFVIGSVLFVLDTEFFNPKLYTYRQLAKMGVKQIGRCAASLVTSPINWISRLRRPEILEEPIPEFED
jgi:hypothetical protein